MVYNLITYDRYLRKEELEQRRKGEEVIVTESKIKAVMRRLTGVDFVIIILSFFGIITPCAFLYAEKVGSSRYFIVLGGVIFLVAILLFSRRRIDNVKVYQSRAYLDRRGYDYRYTAKYSLYIIFTLLLYSFPIILLVTIGYEGVNKTSIAFSDSLDFLLIWLFVTFIFYTVFIAMHLKTDDINYERDMSNYMQTYFLDNKIVVEGKYLEKSYNFSFIDNEIKNFVVLLLRKEAFYELPEDVLIGEGRLRDTLLVYLEDKRGYLYSLSFYVQEEELQENILSTLEEKYSIPVTRIQVQSFQELKNAGIMSMGFFVPFEQSFSIKSDKFITVKRNTSLCSPFFFSKFIKKGGKIKQMAKAVQGIEVVNTGEEKSFVPLRESNLNIRDRLLSPYWYGLNDIIVWLMVTGVAIVNGLLTQSLSIFFLTYILGAPCFIIPTKKWYRLGIDKLPVCFALLCTLFYLL